MRDLLEGNPNIDKSAIANSVHDPANVIDLLRRSPSIMSADEVAKTLVGEGEESEEDTANDDTDYVGSGGEGDNKSVKEEGKAGKKRKAGAGDATAVPKRIKKEGSVIPSEKPPKAGGKKGGAWDEIALVVQRGHESQIKVEECRLEARMEREKLKQETSLQTVAMKLEMKRLELEEKREARLAEALERDKQREHELRLAWVRASSSNTE